MNRVRFLGLAAVAVLALTAFACTSSASANVLCLNNTSTPCSADYGVGARITGNATHMLLTASPNITCTGSQIVTEVTNTGGSGVNVTGKVTSFTFSGCKVASGPFTDTSCEVAATKLPYHGEVTSGAAPNGTLDIKNNGSGNPEIKAICGGFFSCTFSSTLFQLPITGGNPAHVTANQVNLTVGPGFGCPATASWDATYVTTTPVYVKAS